MIDHDSAKRRAFLQQGLGLAGAMAIPGLAPAQPKPAGRDFAGQTLTALVYSGINENTWRKHFVPQFEAATGARVIIDAAWTEGIAKLKTAPGNQAPFDILMTDPIQGYPAIDEGLFRKIELKNLPNLQKFHKAGPNVLLFDERGTLVHRRLYDASLRKPDCKAEIEGFLLSGRKPPARDVDPALAPKEGSQEAFAEAVDLFLQGDLKGCRVPWRRSVDLDREHWISQEQIWVLDAPERFHPYIDVPWQNEQLAAEGRPACACEIEE